MILSVTGKTFEIIRYIGYIQKYIQLKTQQCYKLYFIFRQMHTKKFFMLLNVFKANHILSVGLFL